MPQLLVTLLSGSGYVRGIRSCWRPSIEPSIENGKEFRFTYPDDAERLTLCASYG